MNEKFVSTEVPFQRLGNESILTAKQLLEDPCLADFVKRFSECFDPDHIRDVLIYRP